MSKKKHQHERPQNLPENQNIEDMCRKADKLFFQKLFHNQLGNNPQPCARKFPIKSQNNN